MAKMLDLPVEQIATFEEIIEVAVTRPNSIL